MNLSGSCDLDRRAGLAAGEEPGAAGRAAAQHEQDQERASQKPHRLMIHAAAAVAG